MIKKVVLGEDAAEFILLMRIFLSVRRLCVPDVHTEVHFMCLKARPCCFG